MMSGDALNRVRIAGTVLFAIGWIAWIIYRFVQGGPADAATPFPVFPVFIVLQCIAPADFRRTRVCHALTVVSAAAWLGYVWRFGTADYRHTVFLWVLALIGLSVAGWLLELGHRRWKAIADPMTRLFFATVATTLAVVCSLTGALCALTWASRSLEGGNTSAGWLVALVLNLPLLALFALGFRERRKQGDGNDA
jgi:hypothetical protein